jgi:Na+(H+)/acetate symporter ActP
MRSDLVIALGIAAACLLIVILVAALIVRHRRRAAIAAMQKGWKAASAYAFEDTPLIDELVEDDEPIEIEETRDE